MGTPSDGKVFEPDEECLVCGDILMDEIDVCDDCKKLITDKVCTRCGNKVYEEVSDPIDYPYFCATCNENMYDFEVE